MLQHNPSQKCIVVNGPLIVGAGPSGLAVGAGLRMQGIPFVILERAHCIASLWKNNTYDRLKLHLPKRFCQLPFLPFPPHFPEYPSKYDFLDYLQLYADKFQINPRFNEAVQSARYDESCGLWQVRTGGEVEYLCRWLVVATGENAEKVMPEFSRGGVELVNGTNLEIDSVILATGYCSNVPSWLKDCETEGLYAVGFSRRGLFGASCDAIRVSQDIAKIWNQETSQSLWHTFL